VVNASAGDIDLAGWSILDREKRRLVLDGGVLPSGDAVRIRLGPPVALGNSGGLITLLNPKAIVFYMAFFPLFVDPARHQGLLTFGVMAGTIAALTFLYGLVVVLLTHFLAERLRSNPKISGGLQKLAGVFLIGFGVKLALSSR